LNDQRLPANLAAMNAIHFLRLHAALLLIGFCFPFHFRAALTAQAPDEPRLQRRQAAYQVLLTEACAAAYLENTSDRLDSAFQRHRAFPDVGSPVLKRVLQEPPQAILELLGDSCVAYREAPPQLQFTGNVDLASPMDFTGRLGHAWPVRVASSTVPTGMKASFRGSWPDDPAWLALPPWGEGQPALDYLEATALWEQDPPGVWEGPASLGLVDRWVDTTHPELQQRVHPLWMFDSADLHGTAVAGLMVAETGNGMGLASLLGGWNPVQPVLRVHWDPDPDRAVLELAQAGIGVVAVPWISRCSPSPIQRALYEEVEALGTLVVAAAGNGPGGASCGSDGHGYAYPASLPTVLSVSSTGHLHPRGHTDSSGYAFNWRDVHDLHPVDTASYTHTHNDRVDLLAPGYGVWTTLPFGGYGQGWGTSFAVPLAAATAAAIRSSNPCLDPAASRSLLRASAIPVDGLPENAAYVGRLGAGRLHPPAALSMARGFGAVRVDSGQVMEWSGMHQIRDSLVVEGGGVWILKGTLCMDTGAQIVLKPGAMAVLDSGRILGKSKAHWKGIRVQGHKTLPGPLLSTVAVGAYPNSSADHAVLKWDASSRIEDADTAILVQHGGIVFGQGGALVNNRCALSIRHYPLPWVGQLAEVFYGWEEGASPEGETLTRLRAVQDVRFRGGEWLDGRLPGTRPHRRLGLSAEWASFSVEGGYGSGPPTGTTAARMTGLARGIDAWAPLGAVLGEIHLRNMEFRQTVHPIRLSGIPMPVLESLDLALPAAGRWLDSLPTGIYLDACPGARVQDNTIRSDGPLAYGMVLHASGELPGRVVRNRWDGMREALVVLGRHGDAEGGWHVDCNRFAPAGRALRLAGRWGRHGRLAGDALGDSLLPSGSSLALFGGSCSFSPMANRYAPSAGGTDQKDWHLGGLSPVHYRFHVDDSIYRAEGWPDAKLESNACSGWTSPPASCTAPPAIPVLAMEDSLFTAALIREQLGLNLDNGEQDLVLRAIADSSIGAWRLEVLLSEIGSYASDTVILAVLDRYPDVSQPFFREWLEMQAPWTHRVLHSARDRLPAAWQPWLDSVQAAQPFSLRDAWRGDLQYWNDRSVLWRGKLWDEAMDRRDTAVILSLSASVPYLQARFLAAGHRWEWAWQTYVDWLAGLDSDTLLLSDIWLRFFRTRNSGAGVLPWDGAALHELRALSVRPDASGSLARLLLRWGGAGGAWSMWPRRVPDRRIIPSGSSSASPAEASGAEEWNAHEAWPAELHIWPNPSPIGGWWIDGCLAGLRWRLQSMDGRLLASGRIPAIGSAWFLEAPPFARGPMVWTLENSNGALTRRLLLRP
jgi:hypothetical protein